MKHDVSIAEVQADWAKLCDLDRAKAIKSIIRSGMSIRQIATHLNCSDSLLRHLLSALDAPIEDRVLARQGKISTNDLVRRAKAAGLKRKARHREEVALERERSARHGANQISNWLAEHSLQGGRGEHVIEDVRWEYACREFDGSLPQFAASVETGLNELIGRCKPTRPMDDNADFLNWFHEWLCRWTFFAFPDPYVRDSALDIALEREWHR